MDNIKYLFSLVIPTLNEEKCIPVLLEDVSYQTNKNFETIIVDAQSEDKTKQKALFFKKSTNLTFLTGKEKNIAAQKNYGASNAKGVYLVFIDADFRIKPNFLSDIAKNIEKNTLIIMPYLLPDENSSLIQAMFFLGNILVLLSQYTPKPLSSAGCIIINKKFFNELKGFNDKLYNAEDHDLITRARHMGARAEVKFNIKVISSLRRIRKEGWINALKRMLLANVYILLKGNIKKKIFEYEMGGQAYQTTKDDKMG